MFYEVRYMNRVGNYETRIVFADTPRAALNNTINRLVQEAGFVIAHNATVTLDGATQLIALVKAS